MLENICFLANVSDIVENTINIIAGIAFLIPFTGVLVFLNSAVIVSSKKDGLRGVITIILFMILSLCFLGIAIGVIFGFPKFAIASGITLAVSLVLLISFYYFTGNKKSIASEKNQENIIKEQEEKIKEIIANKSVKTYKFIINWESKKWKLYLAAFIVCVLIVGGMFALRTYKVTVAAGQASIASAVKIFFAFVFLVLLLIAVPICIMLLVRKIINKIRDKNNNDE